MPRECVRLLARNMLSITLMDTAGTKHVTSNLDGYAQELSEPEDFELLLGLEQFHKRKESLSFH
jgi:hypothetical protein